jgi:hypothetical protein
MTTTETTSNATRCQPCAATGQYHTHTVNGKPAGGGGICYRCAGKGYQTLKDKQRNAYYDAHRPETFR